MSQPSKISVRALNKLHIAALAENDALNVAAAAAAADTVSAIGNPPDAPPARVRASLGASLASLTSAVDSRLMLHGYPLNGRPMLRTVADNRRVTIEPVTLTAADAPSLYARAAAMLASVGAVIACDPSLTVPPDAFDSLAASYLGARLDGYFHGNRGTIDRPVASLNTDARHGVSPLDRLMYGTRIAERMMYAADALVSRKPRNPSGGYNGTAPTIARRDSLAAMLVTDSNV